MEINKTMYGQYGGTFLPELLMPVVHRVAEAFERVRNDDTFCRRLDGLLTDYAGRRTPLFLAKNLSERLGPKIYLKREDLCHTGSHKINNVLGQLLLAKTMGYSKVIAETGAGQHGVATATAAALLNLSCTIYMGEEDVARQSLNVYRMKLLGASVVPVSSGSRTLKDATNEAIRSWAACAEDTFYAIGSVVGPHPYPAMVTHFQSVIGTEAREQILDKEGRLPDVALACVGGGSNAAGLFTAFLDDPVALYGAEAGGEGLDTGRHGAALSRGTAGIFQGMRTLILQDDAGNIQPAHSVSAGLDYPGVGPLHAHLKDTGRAVYEAVTDKEAMEAYGLLARAEGIIPALESAHALALAARISHRFSAQDILLICLSGRGDKDTLRFQEEGGKDNA